MLINKVKSFYGRYRILYCNEDFYDKYLAIPEFNECVFWIRGTYKQPKLSDGLIYDFWQYNAKGSVAGVKGIVDLNVYTKSQEEFDSLLD